MVESAALVRPSWDRNLRVVAAPHSPLNRHHAKDKRKQAVMNFLIRWLLLCAPLLLCAAAAAAQTGQPTSTPAAATAQTEQWKEFAPPSSGFKILLPGTPRKLSGRTEIGQWKAVSDSFDLQH